MFVTEDYFVNEMPKGPYTYYVFMLGGMGGQGSLDKNENQINDLKIP